MSLWSFATSLIQETLNIGVASLIQGPQKSFSLASSMLSRWAVRFYLTPPAKESLAAREVMHSAADTAMNTLSVLSVDQLSDYIGFNPGLVNRGVSNILVKGLQSKLADNETKWKELSKNAIKTVAKAYLFSYASNIVSDHVLQEDDDPYVSSQFSVVLGGMASEVLWHYGEKCFARSAPPQEVRETLASPKMSI